MIHMKNTKLLLAIATSAALLTGCQNTHGIDTNMAISSGLNAYKAAKPVSITPISTPFPVKLRGKSGRPP